MCGQTESALYGELWGSLFSHHLKSSCYLMPGTCSSTQSLPLCNGGTWKHPWDSFFKVMRIIYSAQRRNYTGTERAFALRQILVALIVGFCTCRLAAAQLLFIKKVPWIRLAQWASECSHRRRHPRHRRPKWSRWWQSRWSASSPGKEGIV